MDGNGRWATEKKMKRADGHKAGAESIINLMDTALELGIETVSLYAFSTENWKRPVTEINSIFSLLIEFIDNKLETIKKKKIRILHSGSRKKLSRKVLQKLDFAIAETAKNKKLNANFCLNYGAKEEIISSFNRLTEYRKRHNIPIEKAVTEKDLEKHLYTNMLKPVDLMIRTAGEQRLSNFLLWQSAYAEIYFTNTLWPDFNRESLLNAVEWYDKRVRKFGGLVP